MYGSCFRGVNHKHIESIKNYKNYLVRIDKEDDGINKISILPIIKPEELGSDNRCQLQLENPDITEGSQQCVLYPSE